MKRDSGCGEFEGEVLLADWEPTGVDSLRADVCVPAMHGHVRPGGLELSSVVVLEVCRLGAALVAQRAGGASGEWCFLLESFVLEWHGLPPSIPALGVIWCELIVETVDAGEPVDAVDAVAAAEGRTRAQPNHVTWSCTLSAGGRPLVAGFLEGRLTLIQSHAALHEEPPESRSAPGAAAASSPRPLVEVSGDGWEVWWEGRNAPISESGAQLIPPLVLADAVLSATRLRSPEGQVHLVEMRFGDSATRDAGLDLDLSWDPNEQVNLFSMRQGGRTVATARVGLLGRESLGLMHAP